MLRNTIYYNLKPFIPHQWRIAIRRTLVQRQRDRFKDIWPIMPGSEHPPADWLGWPEGKSFAVVLTHDVERQAGIDKCRELMSLEMELGFRSSFNFIPEGNYHTPRKLREELVQNSFEVGVHDLKHNGRLYRSRSEFRANAERINSYLRDWGAVGFRSGFMLHNLDWLHDLEIEYDASTFDTDPFEPQPEGRHTIFPCWIPRLPAASAQPNGSDPAVAPATNGSSPGYIELPYTLPQDSTLFLFLREPSIDLWINKVDWIAAHGGMILLDTHPDYMAMGNSAASGHEYPVRFYSELLEYIRSKYEGQYWHALPREVAAWARTKGTKAAPNGIPRTVNRARASNQRPKIWIDLDNTPHVPFFEPIVDELQARQYPVLITARDAFQVCDLADKKGFKYTRIGRHHGKNPAFKVAGLIHRSMQLAPVIRREKPFLGVSHGSRSQLLLGSWFSLPTVLIEDYEYCKFPLLMRPSWVIAPTIIPEEMLPTSNGRIRTYEGIKEDVYAWKLNPTDPSLQDLGLTESDLVVTVRPPATEAHYHNPQSERLFDHFMERASATPGVKVVLLPRNKKQGDAIRQHWPGWFRDGKVIIPEAALDGLNLLWHSDLVVSGGGTMNREAAALGVPVYSIFRGTIGAVDRHLTAQGRLVMIETTADVESKIPLVKRRRNAVSEVTSQRTLCEIVDSIEEIAEFCRRSV